MAKQPKKDHIQRTKVAPPPPELPVYTDNDHKNVSYIGETNYVAALEEKKFIFGIKRKDRQHHVYIIGKSGVGKSKLQELLIRQDIANGHGVCLLDPHGEIIDNLLDFIPKHRIDDVCIIDPSDTEFPLSFNPLLNIEPSYKHQLTRSMVEVFEKQFDTNWTPRLEHLLRFSLLALLDYPDATLYGIVELITNKSYRANVIEYITDDIVKRFWEIEFQAWSEKFDADAVLPLMNKLGQFLTDPMFRNIFNQKENRIDFKDLMDKNKIILVNLSRGKIGEENAVFFGSIIVTKIKQAGIERATSEKKSSYYYLYIDDFHGLVSNTLMSLLSESRKYFFNLTVAHQYIGQLPVPVQHAVIGVAGTMICMRVGGEDAVKLKPEFTPVFDVKDLINLRMGEFYIKPIIDGETYDPFSARTLRIYRPAHQSYREEIIAASREKYSSEIN